jgi:hypothetical protein
MGFSALQRVFKKSKADILQPSEGILPDFMENRGKLRKMG